MAQLDPSIILQSRRPTLPSGEDMLRLRDLGQQGQIRELQLEDARRARLGQQTLADLYRANTRPDGTVDTAAVTAGMAQAGYGEQVPGLVKQGREAGKADLDMKGAQVDLHLKKLGVVNQTLGALLADPQVSHDRVISAISGLVDQGIIDNQQGAQMVRTLPGPDRLRQFLVEKAMETMTAAQQLEATRPKYDEQDRGGTISQGTIDPLTGQRTAGAEVRKTISPDAAAQAAAMAANPGVTYQPDANGNLVAVPSKAAPGAPVRAQAVLGPDGQPLSGKSNATEDQAKAAGWLAQATNAFGNMEAAMKEDPGAVKPGAAEFVSAIPSMGLGEAAGNAMRSPTRQRYVQAAASLSEALLRAATGAGVNAQEAKQKIEEITPKWGDSDEVIAQKRAAIPVYLESLRARAGNAGRHVPPPSIARPPAAGAVVQVKSDADYNALPSGTEFIAPDGTHRVKP